MKKKKKLKKNNLVRPLLVALIFGCLGTALLVFTFAQSAAWDSTKTYSAGNQVQFDGREWKANATIGVNQQPLGSGDGSAADRNLLLSRRAGFGANANGGGASGALVHVTNANDSGAGSLRAAVTGNNAAWVVFDGDYIITLSSGVQVGSNKTIDGRGRKVTISAPGQNGLVMSNVSNDIIENLVMTKFGDFTKRKANNTPDGINVDSSHDVWIDHNTLSEAGDKLVSINSGSTNITVSWNHFYETQAQFDFGDTPQVFQIGSQTNGDNGGTGLDVGQTVTIHHNFFEDNGYRHPVVAYGKAHAYNNDVYHWGAFGMKAERTGQLYAENNIFEPSSNLNAILNKPADDGCNDTGKYCDSRLGFVKSVGNVANGAKINENEPDKVFNPHSSYSYNADPADANLANRLKTYTGSQTVWVLATGSQQPPPNNPPPQNPPPNNPPPNQPPAGGTGSAGGDTPADGGSVTVTPSGTSTGAPVASVEYKIDGRTVKKTTNGNPVTLDTNNLSPGEHTITALTTGTDGSVAETSTTIFVPKPSLLHLVFVKYLWATLLGFTITAGWTTVFVWRSVLHRFWPVWLRRILPGHPL